MKGKDILFGLTDVGNDLIEKAEYGQFPSDTKSSGEKESHGIIRIRRPLSVAAIIALMVLLMGCAVLLLHLEDLRIGEETYGAVANIGTRPTVEGQGITIEPWILDFSGDLYRQEITLEFLDFLRPDIKFPTLEALREEIQHNARQTREILKAL